MSRKWIGALLVAVTIAALVQNLRQLLASSPILVASDEDLQEEVDDAEGGSEGSPALAYADVIAYLEQLPAPARSPFLTRSEAERLGARGGDSGGEGVFLMLTGTMWSGARRVAWIQGIPRSEGDVFAEYRLDRIGVGSAVLASERGNLRLVVGDSQAAEEGPEDGEGEDGD